MINLLESKGNEQAHSLGTNQRGLRQNVCHLIKFTEQEWLESYDKEVTWQKREVADIYTDAV